MGNGMSNDIEIFAEGEIEQEFKRRGGAGEIGLKELVVKGYNDVIKTVIRPPRASYDDAVALGPEQQLVGGQSEQVARRKDFHVLNDRGLKLMCSHWQLFANEDATAPEATPCLLYLHSNLGSRVDSERVRALALERGISVFAFDFSGSGNSDGVYVTMGWNESKDLHFILEHLERDTSVQNICIYAHSMGTFPAIVNVACRSPLMETALKEQRDILPAYFRYGASDLTKPIKGLVLDGGYSTMAQLIEELMHSVQKEGFKVPIPVMKLACKVVRQSIKKRAEVDLNLLKPVEFVPACAVPACFISGKEDRYVQTHHSRALANAYGGPAIVLEVEGDHYGLRSADIYREAVDFLFGSLRSVILPPHTCHLQV
ncbi:TPA: hypothetical protein N0F65_010453 [Lagenidium giganteum]|uniref:Serine aminopeptidase S33 domain-containing protein n=1 Tax=Lagenidium giganteum TaxID=4803 RepID=A0AAV2YQ97_9STRA|nr:TPA: hypothetical protein N0F65_010453 [Lagenidium giganteum]